MKTMAWASSVFVLLAGPACGDSTSPNLSAGGPDSGAKGDASQGSDASSPPLSGAQTSIAGCRIFPNDNPWNRDVSAEPVDTAAMATVMPKMALSTAMHPDWGTVSDQYGIPYDVGTGAPPVSVTFNSKYGASESDKRPCPGSGGQFCYPIPLTARIEGGPSSKPGSDRHVLFLDTAGAPDNCTLYELYNAQNPTGGGWTCASAAIFPLGTNALRPEGWTSADAAGLPVLPGLVRYDEVVKGEITHAIRFTMDATRNAYIHPATHAAGLADVTLPPMGLRVRLKKSFDLSGFKGPSLVILIAMKKYGLLLADNGSNWFFTGESNEGWAPLMDGLLSDFGKVTGADFEIVKSGDVVVVPVN